MLRVAKATLSFLPLNQNTPTKPSGSPPRSPPRRPPSPGNTVVALVPDNRGSYRVRNKSHSVDSTTAVGDNTTDPTGTVARTNDSHDGKIEPYSPGHGDLPSVGAHDEYSTGNPPYPGDIVEAPPKSPDSKSKVRNPSPGKKTESVASSYSSESSKMSNMVVDRPKAREYIVELMSAHTRYGVMSRSPSNGPSSSSSRVDENDRVVPRRETVNKYTRSAKSPNRPSKTHDTDFAMSCENASCYPGTLLLRPAVEANVGSKESSYRNHTRYHHPSSQGHLLVVYTVIPLKKIFRE